MVPLLPRVPMMRSGKELACRDSRRRFWSRMRVADGMPLSVREWYEKSERHRSKKLQSIALGDHLRPPRITLFCACLFLLGTVFHCFQAEANVTYMSLVGGLEFKVTPKVKR